MPVFAAVDIGANSVRLKIAQLTRGRLRVVHEDREVTRLGASVFQTGLLAPEATLQRGYSVTMDRHGNVLRSSSDIELGAEISTLLAGGSKLGSRVTKVD